MPNPTFYPASVIPNVWPYAATAADFPVTGTTAQTATALAVTLDANRTYIVQCGAIFSCSSAAATVGLGWTGPAGAVMKWNNTTGSTGYRNAIGLTDTYTGSTAAREAFFLGRIVTGSAGGSLTLTISTSDSAQTATLLADSWLLTQRVA